MRDPIPAGTPWAIGHGCAYCVQFDERHMEEIRCGKPTVVYERYCATHVSKILARLNIFGDVMPDHPEAPWLRKEVP